MVLIQCQVSSQEPSPPSLLLLPLFWVSPSPISGFDKRKREKQKGMGWNLLRCGPHNLTSSWNCSPEELLLLPWGENLSQGLLPSPSPTMNDYPANARFPLWSFV